MTPLCFQLLRKRHIGNDIVTIIFQEPGALPFTPKNIRSHFQHVFIIVRVHNPCTENVCYRYGHSVLSRAQPGPERLGRMCLIPDPTSPHVLAPWFPSGPMFLGSFCL